MNGQVVVYSEVKCYTVKEIRTTAMYTCMNLRNIMLSVEIISRKTTNSMILFYRAQKQAKGNDILYRHVLNVKISEHWLPLGEAEVITERST